jgi:hypothetical protein
MAYVGILSFTQNILHPQQHASSMPKLQLSGYNKWYGNFVAGLQHGISLGCEAQQEDPSILCYPDDKIYNNTFVDCTNNITIWRSDSRNNIDIKNNISWLPTTGIGSRHVYSSSPAGVTWSHNLFRGGALPTGNATINMVTGGLSIGLCKWHILVC